MPQKNALFTKTKIDYHTTEKYGRISSFKKRFENNKQIWQRTTINARERERERERAKKRELNICNSHNNWDYTCTCWICPVISMVLCYSLRPPQSSVTNVSNCLYWFHHPLCSAAKSLPLQILQNEMST